MQNFLAKCAVLALLAGGFAFTGDATRLVGRGRGILEATTVPNAAPASDAQAPVPTAPPAPPPTPSDAGHDSSLATDPVASSTSELTPSAVSPTDVAESEPAPSTPARPVDAPVGAPVTTTIPGGGPEAVKVSGLAPGDRVTLWIGKPSGRGRAVPVAFDIVDPATGDAIELRPAASGLENQATLAPCRRVRIIGSVGTGLLGNGQMDTGRIVRRQTLCVAAPEGHGGTDGRSGRETIGPVMAIAVIPAAPASAARTAP